MDLFHSGVLDNVGGIVEADAAASHNLDSVASQVDQLSDRADAVGAGLFAARGEKAVRSGGANVFEGLHQIR